VEPFGGADVHPISDTVVLEYLLVLTQFAATLLKQTIASHYFGASLEGA